MELCIDLFLIYLADFINWFFCATRLLLLIITELLLHDDKRNVNPIYLQLTNEETHMRPRICQNEEPLEDCDQLIDEGVTLAGFVSFLPAMVN